MDSFEDMSRGRASERYDHAVLRELVARRVWQETMNQAHFLVVVNGFGPETERKLDNVFQLR